MYILHMYFRRNQGSQKRDLKNSVFYASFSPFPPSKS